MELHELQISLEEAQMQLVEKTNRVQQIKAKMAEMQTLAMSATKSYVRNETALAEAVLAGGGIDQALHATAPQANEAIKPAPVSPSEARRIVSGLEMLLAAALDEENQARSAVRRAGVGELKAMLQTERQAYDRQAQELMRQWARVTALSGKAAAVLGVQQHGPGWASMRLPRAIPPKVLAPFTNGEFWGGSEEILQGGVGNQARTEVDAMLKAKGIN